MTKHIAKTVEEILFVFSYLIVALHTIFQGLRPDPPENAHPKLLDLMQRCWDAAPDKRLSFSEIKIELEALLQEVQVDI